MTPEELVLLEAKGLLAAERYRVNRQARRDKKRKDALDAMLAEYPELAPDPNAPIEYKTCSMCDVSKPLSEYHFINTKRSGKCPWKFCKKCYSLMQTQKNLEKYLNTDAVMIQTKAQLEVLKLEQEGKRKCRVCMCEKPLDDYAIDARIIKRTGKLRYRTICKDCVKILEKPDVMEVNYIRGKTTPLVTPIIMNPDKPELCVVDKHWLLDPADEEHWQLNPDVVALVQELIHLPLTSNSKEPMKLQAGEEYKQIEAPPDVCGNCHWFETERGRMEQGTFTAPCYTSRLRQKSTDTCKHMKHH